MTSATAQPLAQVAPAPVIILASREAGGSIVSDLLGAHPAFCAAPQLNLLAFPDFWQLMQYAQIPRDSHIHGLLRFLAETLFAEQSIKSIEAAQRWLSRWQNKSSAELHDALCRLIAPRRLVSYNPLASQGIDAMRRVLAAAPDATIIHVVRNPIGQGMAMRWPVWQSVTTSLVAWGDRGTTHPTMDIFEIGEQYIDWSSSPNVFDPQFSWHRTQRAARTLASEPENAGRLITLRYEDIQRDPAAEMTSLLTRLGEADDAETVATMLAAGPSPYAAPGPYQAPSGCDYEILNRSAVAALEMPPATDMEDPEAPLKWRGDGQSLLPPVVALAQEFCYFPARR